ncbi:MAG: tRNA (adenosine(37)-N6)-threonylcarbamoyltransferase complex transferase subunit TsaD [Bacillota bacterium]
MPAIDILAIETSCDETSAAVVRDGRQVLASVVSSQADLHKRYGGVVPELASRRHVESVIPAIDQTLDEAGVAGSDLAAVAVTKGPGLVGALLVGVAAAKGLALAWGKPLIGLHHLEGHIYANWLREDQPGFPCLALVVSGGHTDLILMEGHGRYRRLGQTRDDAAGEAFDKVARALGLGYPGGPVIDRLAHQGDPRSYELPRAYLEEGTYDTSFSGLKTAVLNEVNRLRQRGEELRLPDLAASFQAAIVDVLAERVERAIVQLGVRKLLVAGGVAANSGLRDRLTGLAHRLECRLFIPPPRWCTDNAAMIGAAAYQHWLAGRTDALNLNATASLPLA